MGPLRLRVDEQRLLLGRHTGLPQATATITVGLDGVVDESALSRIRAGATSLRAGVPLFGATESDWPAIFLVDDGFPFEDGSPFEDGGVSYGPQRALAEWIVAVTVALQRWAGDAVWRGRVLSAHGGRIQVALPWQRDGVLSDVLRLTLQLLEMWAGSPPDGWPDVNSAISAGMDAARADGLSPDAVRFALAGVERGIPVDRRPGYVQFGWGVQTCRMRSTFTGATSQVACAIAQNKVQSTRILGDAGLPVPAGCVVADVDAALRAANALGWPVVVKPLNQERGRGVTAGIGDESGLRRAFESAHAFSPGQVVVEEHVAGADHRLRVVNGRCISVLRRTPGGITGDGISTVAALVSRANTDPRRGEQAGAFMAKLTLDGEALDCLAAEGLQADSIPSSGRWIALRRIANLSAGGTAEDVTDAVHPDNRRLAERAARIVGLDIAGVDFLTSDITRSWQQVGGAVCEVNALPELGDPDRDIHGEILDVLFDGRSGRIPVAAVTGGRAANPVALLAHHIGTAAGRCVGLAAAAVIKVGAEIVSTEAFAGLPRAGLVLNDPAVEMAVLELSAGEIEAIGQPCDRYDVLTVIAEGGQPAHVAEMLPWAGAVVLGAEDSNLPAMPARSGPGRRIVVDLCDGQFARDGDGGETVSVAELDGRPWITHNGGGATTALAAAQAIPPHRVRQAMFAAATAWALGVEAPTIGSALACVDWSALDDEAGG